MKCLKIFTENFELLQIVFMEMIGKSPSSYPKISYETIMTSILEQQKTEEEKKGLQRSQIELAFMGSTRIDGVKGLGGSLSRGQFLETIIRLVQQRYPKEKASVHLEDFI